MRKCRRIMSRVANRLLSSSSSSLSSSSSSSLLSSLSTSGFNDDDIRITRISCYRVALPLHEQRYSWGRSKHIDVFDSTIIQIDTNRGISGFGEQCPLGPSYLPQFAAATREGVRLLAPDLIGANPTRISAINYEMDRLLRGHPYVKSAIDIALWDILGKVARLPVCTLLGGRFGDSFPLYRAISQGTADDMVANVDKYLAMGYRKFQLKVGSNVSDDIKRIRQVRRLLDDYQAIDGTYIPLLCDANTGWQMHEAIQVINAVKDLDVYIEQPCLTYDECLSVRRMSPLPMVLDECMDDIGVLVKIIADKAADVINLKISKCGGLTKARAIRDLAVASGIPMNIEDTWGSDIVTASISHLAQSTPPHLLFCSTDFNSYGPVSVAKTTARRGNSARLSAPTDFGLGVEPYKEVLGAPVFVIE